jgi:uncharacterized repeat protein (TIGR01451 family)
MNKLKIPRRFLIRMIGILSIIISLGNSGRALAAPNSVDVSVTIVADQSKVKPGQDITYTVTATNHGPDAALFVDVIHGLSDQLNVVSMTCDRGISADGPFCEYSILGPGETVVSILVATPKADAQNRERNVITTANLAFETADTVDSDSSNNSAVVTIKLIGRLNHP